MSILVDENTKVLVQGITGGFGITSGTISVDCFGEFAFWGLNYDVRYHDGQEWQKASLDHDEKFVTVGANVSVELQ